MLEMREKRTSPGSIACRQEGVTAALTIGVARASCLAARQVSGKAARGPGKETVQGRPGARCSPAAGGAGKGRTVNATKKGRSICSGLFLFSPRYVFF